MAKREHQTTTTHDSIFDDGPSIAWDAAKNAVFTKAGTLRKRAAAEFTSEGIIASIGTKADPRPKNQTDENQDSPNLRIASERRRIPRREVNGGAMAVFASGRGAGTLTRVELLDASWNGMGLKSPILVEPGTSVSVIPEHAMSPRQVGIVVRCEKIEEGYRLGLMCRVQKAVA